MDSERVARREALRALATRGAKKEAWVAPRLEQVEMLANYVATITPDTGEAESAGDPGAS